MLSIWKERDSSLFVCFQTTTRGHPREAGSKPDTDGAEPGPARTLCRWIYPDGFTALTRPVNKPHKGLAEYRR